MVQAIENWADLTATVRELRPRPGAANMTDLVLAVAEAQDVEGYPNLLADAVGTDLAMAIETHALNQLNLTPGDTVEVRAQRASPRDVVAHPEGLHRPTP